MVSQLKPVTALGHDAPLSVEIGPYLITERFDVAFASVAARHGREAELAQAAGAAGFELPAIGQWRNGPVYSGFWVSSDMWFVEAPFDTHEDIVAHLKPILGELASITEQTDAWVAFEIAAPSMPTLFERLCNLDLATAKPGMASRTMIEHMGCYLIKRSDAEVRLYGPRSSAKGLLHALKVAARSVI